MTSKAKSLLKYIVAFALLFLILRHAQTEKIAHDLARIPPWSILFLLFLVTVAQVASALRMRYFFHASGFPMSEHYGIILFYVGAFYNFLLPGGIGGDAYKVILARKRMDMPAMQGIRIMLADRASGLCILMLLFFAMLMRDDFSSLTQHAHLLLLLCGAFTLISYVLLSQWFLKQPARVMLTSLVYSLAVQGLWVLMLAVLWLSLGDGRHLGEYIALYCAASITGMLPFSVGGLGIKEMTYFYGANLLQRTAHIPVDPELGVAISLCLFAVALLGSLPGLYWLEKVGITRVH